MTTKIHDSNQPVAHIGTNPDGTCSDESCPCQEWAKQATAEKVDPAVARDILTAIRQDQTFASLTTVAAAVYDVIDAGDEWRGSSWLFFSTDEGDEQSATRVRFVEAVKHRILALQREPHEMDTGLRAAREDVEEMRRLGEREDRTMSIDSDEDIGVTCDECHKHNNVDVSNVVHERMRSRGWRMNSEHGDICSDCVKKLEGEE